MSDEELLDLVRTGDEAAFTQLYKRHSAAARRLASGYTGAADADELVDDAFQAVLNALRNGTGPTESFRAYLFVALRRLAKRRHDRGPDAASDPIDDATHAPAVEPSALADLPDRHIVMEAFQSLPDKWQEILWYTAVEGESPKDIAPRLGLSPNAAAAQAYRAREKLRQAYLQAHLHSTAVPGSCEPYRSLLGAYARDGLSRPQQAEVADHIQECAACRGLATELQDVNTLLLRSLVPVVPIAGAIGIGVVARAYASRRFRHGLATIVATALIVVTALALVIQMR